MKYLDFYQHLREAKYGRFWRAYWMDARGTFYEVYTDEAAQKGHFWFAKTYCIKHDIDFSAEGPEKEMFKRGWVRLVFNYYGDKTLSFDYEGSNPMSNTTQRKAIRVKADELLAEKIFDDKLDREVEL